VFRSILPATILSSLMISAVWAAPISPASGFNQLSSTNFTQVGDYDKKYYKNKKYYKDKDYKYYGKSYNKNYYHGGRYWGHRYSYRPPGWQTLGCVAVGPVWYCP
jgi:hypothetical protein